MGDAGFEPETQKSGVLPMKLSPAQVKEEGEGVDVYSSADR